MVPRLCLLLAALARAAPEFPLQFRAVVETTAHLVDRAQDYPPWLRRVQLDYDYVNKRARAAVLLGLDAGKNFTRRYDAAQEYAVRGEPYPDCKRSYLGEAMPMPAYPSTAALAEADVDIDGSRHERWLVDIPGAERTHVYVRADTRWPRRLVGPAASAPVGFARPRAPAADERGARRRRLRAAHDLRLRRVRGRGAGRGRVRSGRAVDEGDLRPARAAPAPGGRARRRPRPPSQVGGWPYLHLFHHYLMV